MTGAGQKKNTDNTVWMNEMKNDKSLMSSGAFGGESGGEIGSFTIPYHRVQHPEQYRTRQVPWD